VPCGFTEKKGEKRKIVEEKGCRGFFGGAEKVGTDPRSPQERGWFLGSVGGEKGGHRPGWGESPKKGREKERLRKH